MSWRDIMGGAPGPMEKHTQNSRRSPNFEDIEYGSAAKKILESAPAKTAYPEVGSIGELLIILTLAIHASRIQPRLARATGRRTSIEDGLAVAKCMDTLDAFAKAASSRPELLSHARAQVDQAAGLIRQWNFYQAYRVLDELRRLAA